MDWYRSSKCYSLTVRIWVCTGLIHAYGQKSKCTPLCLCVNFGKSNLLSPRFEIMLYMYLRMLSWLIHWSWVFHRNIKAFTHNMHCCVNIFLTWLIYHNCVNIFLTWLIYHCCVNIFLTWLIYHNCAFPLSTVPVTKLEISRNLYHSPVYK